MPTLDRGLAAFDRWWSGLSVRERRMVAGLALILALVALILLVVRPLQAAKAEALADIRLHETLNARILAAGRLDATQTTPAGSPEQLAQQAAGQLGAAFTAQGDGFVLTLTEADYALLIGQLGQVTRGGGLAVTRADLVRGNAPGRVSGTVELAR
jgi:general secretion pathway protein M